MVTRILVPLDGSPLAARALPYATALARATHARLILLRVVEAHGLTVQSRTRAQITVLQEAEAYLEQLAAPLRTQGLTVDVATPYDVPAEAILDEIALRDADLVVMATHGRGGLGRWVCGSVAARILHATKVPVLLVRAWQEQPTQPFAAKPRIIVPLDGSPFAEAALPTARDLAATLGGELLFVQAVAPPEVTLVAEFAYAMFDPEAELAAATTYLRDLTAAEIAAGRPAQFVTQVAHPVSLLAEVARANNAALIVMATHGRNNVGRLVMGSVADATLREGNTPLLLVRPQDGESDEVQQRATATMASATASSGAPDTGEARYW